MLKLAWWLEQRLSEPLSSPFLVGLIADRLFATEKVLAAVHLLGGMILLAASLRSSFGPVYILVLLYALCYMPTLALTNSLAFRQMKDPKTEFGPIRVLGTGGWIVAGLLIGTLRLEATSIPMRIAGCGVVFYGPVFPDTSTHAALDAISAVPFAGPLSN